MSHHTGHNDDNHEEYTTNAQDLQDAANIQSRLSKKTSPETFNSSSMIHHSNCNYLVPSVSIDEGAHKYVLITAIMPSSSSHQTQTFVYSRRHAKYHVNVAESIIPQLEREGYRSIKVLGGGRIQRDDNTKKIHIFGFSYGFGKADHSMAKQVVEQSVHFQEYEVSWSNDGY